MIDKDFESGLGVISPVKHSSKTALFTSKVMPGGAQNGENDKDAKKQDRDMKAENFEEQSDSELKLELERVAN